MTLVFTAALAIALLIAAPIAAHLLHVHRAQKTPFPPTHLVPPSPATHKHTRKLEHRYLLLVRLLAILALTLLGTSPLLTCSRLSISRDGGASIALAIVVDDSMSMRVRDDPSDALSTRFARAKQDAVDLLSGLRDGDSVAIILAGDPVRIALAPSTNLATAKQTLDQIAPSDRATDLDSAIAIASSLVAAMPQPQHQIVVLTDRCDGNPDGPPLGHNATVPIWIVDRPATQPTAQPSHDCAVLRAEERSGRVIAKVACTGPRQDSNRSLVARGNGKELARVALQTRMSDDDHEVEIDLALPTSTFADHVALEDGADSIPENDIAPVMRSPAIATIGVVSDSVVSKTETGGPPPVEQAIIALQTDAIIHPLSVLPDTIEDLSNLTALVLDDPPGFSPEARDALAQWINQGGIVLIGLGPRAASTPLGSSLNPILPTIPRWLGSPPEGISDKDAMLLGPSGPSLKHLRPSGRSHIEIDNLTGVKSVTHWSDGLPFMVSTSSPHSETASTTIIGLPFTTEHSDFPLRPAFLSIIWNMCESARTRGGSMRIEVGQTWTIPHTDSQQHPLIVRTESGPYPTIKSNNSTKITPHTAGRYDVQSQNGVESRFAVIPSREINLQPRASIHNTDGPNREFGSMSTQVDISRWIALALLGLLATELVLRRIYRVGHEQVLSQ